MVRVLPDGALDEGLQVREIHPLLGARPGEIQLELHHIQRLISDISEGNDEVVELGFGLPQDELAFVGFAAVVCRKTMWTCIESSARIRRR